MHESRTVTARRQEKAADRKKKTLAGFVTVILCLVLITISLTACGTSKSAKNVNLTDFYTALAEKLGWDDQSMAEVPKDQIADVYPGLEAIEKKQFIARMPMISAVVNEVVFLECANESDAAKAAEILQKRIDDQASAGAWYPESMEAWGKGEVITSGSYVAMIASSEYQSEIADAFRTALQGGGK